MYYIFFILANFLNKNTIFSYFRNPTPDIFAPLRGEESSQSRAHAYADVGA